MAKTNHPARHNTVGAYCFDAGAQPVDSLPMRKIQETIKWRGFVKLHINGERCESFLSELEYPPKSGKSWYVDSTTGLLFDKQTGLCRQSTFVSLDMALEPSAMTRADLRKWVAEKEKSDWAMSVINRKPGPKPKGSVINNEDGGDDDAFDD